MRDPLQVDNTWIDCGGDQLRTGDHPLGGVTDSPRGTGNNIRLGAGNDVLVPPTTDQRTPPGRTGLPVDMC